MLGRNMFAARIGEVWIRTAKSSLDQSQSYYQPCVGVSPRNPGCVETNVLQPVISS